MEPEAEPQPAPEPAPDLPRTSRSRRVALTLLAATLALGLFYGVVAAAFTWRQPLRTAFSTLDAHLELRLDSDDASVAEQTRRILDERLRRSELPGRLTRADGALFVIEHRAQDAEAVRALATTRGDLRFMLVIEDVTELDRRSLFEHVQAVRAREGTLPAREPRDALLFHDWVRVLERPGVGGAGAFTTLFETVDELGRPAIGFELSPAAGREFRRLTRSNVGRLLAIVLDDEVLSIPMIRDEIGRKGIIEGGDRGWSEAELQHLVGVLSSDPLPARLIPTSGE
jgi:preprotein translocase subunit SecD